VDGITVFLNDFGHFPLDLLSPYIILGHTEHFVSAVFIDKIIKIELRMACLMAETIPHFKLFPKLKFWPTKSIAMKKCSLIKFMKILTKIFLILRSVQSHATFSKKI
jgi:hypothetical protein